MHIINKSVGTLKDIEFPKILYKYRDWHNKNNKRFITNREVFMASPSSFEDKIDCKLPVRYDLLTEKEALVFAMNLSKRVNPSFNRQRHRRDSIKWVKEKTYIKNYEEYTAFYFEEYDKRLGVLSLTEHNCLDKMWEKYANKHQGFCIGYNSEKLFDYLGGGGIVEYYEKMPIILPQPFMNIDTARALQVYQKEKKWEFEKEYRTQKFWINGATIADRQIKLPADVFHHIILGNRMNTEDENEIRNEILQNIGNIPILKEDDICVKT
ncbi:DUF2971 domain-containing protein [Chryseobacterium sp. L7]|uniref:DUF2971 domain-containing protein n=1 Tax=Chryseobacterium endalhagicum TaxID=2797638 RepID=A0ABS1QI45_9FLAO|nr:DUF2971 domain-containing protein [Chryseobacterium endalhagicum]MBL1221563.1 DUF2971 domain-containing protein [Chryseobacterium endalhagicum]